MVLTYDTEVEVEEVDGRQVKNEKELDLQLESGDLRGFSWCTFRKPFKS